jgi:hypothetical protein
MTLYITPHGACMKAQGGTPGYARRAETRVSDRPRATANRSTRDL